MYREGIKHFTASVISYENDRILMHFHKKLPLWLYLAGHIKENFFARKFQKKTGGWHWHLDMIYLCSLPADLIDVEGEFKWLTVPEIEALPTPREFPSLIRRAIVARKYYSNI
ncbi:hypothetical protein NE897_00700 [Yersinia ruckeri]|uniref:Uncharacterized protein n=2 Tax=Yersinia ruckeri TaxID=29486 RepID=A0A0A5HBW1_YERRU|nr:hypothetical protein [Yersinia ruckeri]AKA37254.1 hypothetical protein UGYR_01820 [Yersinia ruckeri]AUQ43094.1 hypothetical protein NJ56_14985 [Yersinia ruckeri]EEQ00447.1 hypothetical protein yruck0001_12670 [Yersinia ruckeri ATCC 29473]EKN3347614.1 hypothetical protein [Yersinia ruckeri]EKN3360808.1 hypothetical protein [Yersinia ruckeri]